MQICLRHLCKETDTGYIDNLDVERLATGEDLEDMKLFRKVSSVVQLLSAVEY